MILDVGTRLGPYEIVSLIGKGGMGEVWRARDTRLARDVAIKLLLSQLADEGRSRLRFEREARIISQLNHPNICTLYDVGENNGTSYLVMELIAGESLANRLGRGPLPLAEVLESGAQIASALDRAHRNSIVHRDLKPGNIMLTPGGAKLLDFGLAKPHNGSGSSEEATLDALTQEGSIVGTLQYMAPEQLEGGEADHRTDIFAYGAVLYEMATGKRAFSGRTRSNLMAAILKEEPRPMADLVPLVPPALAHIVARCLAKDPEERWQSGRDIALQLQWISRQPSDSSAALTGARPRQTRRFALAWLIAAVSLIAAMAAGVLAWRVSHAPRPRFVRQLTLPMEGSAPVALTADVFAVSPDGKSIVYSGSNDASSDPRLSPKQLFLRRLDGGAATPIPGTDNGASPFFSPDGEWIAFGSGGKLQKVQLASGIVLAICDIQGLVGGAWGEDDTIFFAQSTGPLSRVSASGGVPVSLTRIDEPGGEYSHRLPELLPGGKTLLFTSISPGRASIESLRLDTGVRRSIIPGARGRYDGARHLVVASEGVLRSYDFDPSSLRISGNPVLIADTILMSDLFGFAQFALLPDGAVIYLMPGGSDSQIVTYDRSGHSTLVSPVARAFNWPRYSPDGRRVAVDDWRGNLWLCDADGAACEQATTGELALQPLWSRDGSRLIFRCGPSLSDLCEAPTDDLAHRTRVMKWDKPWPLAGPYALTPDDREIIFGVQESRRSWDLWVQRAESRPASLVTGTSQESDATLSPDGAWMAYGVSVSWPPELMDIVVQRYPPTGEKWIVARKAGRFPVWRGNEIYYTAGRRLMAIEVTTAPQFSAAKPRVVFTAEAPLNPFDVSPDGQTFVTTVSLADQPTTRFNIVEGMIGGPSD